MGARYTHYQIGYIERIYSFRDPFGRYRLRLYTAKALCRVLRTSSKKRMFRKLKQKYSLESAASYLGMLKHGNAYKLIRRISNEVKKEEEG